MFAIEWDAFVIHSYFDVWGSPFERRGFKSVIVHPSHMANWQANQAADVLDRNICHSKLSERSCFIAEGITQSNVVGLFL